MSTFQIPNQVVVIGCCRSGGSCRSLVRSSHWHFCRWPSVRVTHHGCAQTRLWCWANVQSGDKPSCLLGSSATNWSHAVSMLRLLIPSPVCPLAMVWQGASTQPLRLQPSLRSRRRLNARRTRRAPFIVERDMRGRWTILPVSGLGIYQSKSSSLTPTDCTSTRRRMPALGGKADIAPAMQNTG